MYLDCVVDEDLNPVFNDQPNEVRAWLVNRVMQGQLNGMNDMGYRVCVGQSLRFVSIEHYLEGTK